MSVQTNQGYIYIYYIKAKSDPKIRYMNRMKKLWEQTHPELTFFSAKNLRDQARRVEKSRVAMETEYRIDSDVVDNGSTEENCQHSIGHSTVNNTLILSGTEIQTAENRCLKLMHQIMKLLCKI